jgi:hypothetical protein
MSGEFGRHYFYYDCPLEPGETRRLETLHLYSGPGDWRSVQRAWRRIQGVGADPVTRAVSEAAQTGSYLELGLDAHPLVVSGPEGLARLKVTSPRQFALTGEIELVAPDGWTVDPERVAYQVDREHPVDVPIRLTANGAAGPGLYTGELRLHSQVLDHTAGFTVIRLEERADGVAVAAGTEAGYETWEIDSGPSRWTVVPGFHAGVTAWRTRDAETNHLFSPFPESGELLRR